MRWSSRVGRIDPFHVMEVAKAASALAASPACDPEQGGRRMVYLNMGEPADTAVEAVQRAATEAIARGDTGYTPALGLMPLRQAIARWYRREGLDIDPARVVVTAGASAALQLLMLALVDEGQEVLMPDPSYPCNRHFVAAVGGRARLLPTGVDSRFQVTAAQVGAAWDPHTAGVLLASPSNPTGTSLEPAELQRVIDTAHRRGGFAVVDEIYLGLSYDDRYGRSALQCSEHVMSVNSFSKYFGMTGWRLGWMVVPAERVPALERLAQNLYICASTVAQKAALAAFEPASLQRLEQRRGQLKARRDRLLEGLERLGWSVPVPPDGAFYAWVDVQGRGSSSSVVQRWLHELQLAAAPGLDFGPQWAERFLRLSFAGSMADVDEALHRLEGWS